MRNDRAFSGRDNRQLLSLANFFFPLLFGGVAHFASHVELAEGGGIAEALILQNLERFFGFAITTFVIDELQLKIGVYELYQHVTGLNLIAGVMRDVVN